MKILQVITSLQFGGAENLVSEISPLLRDYGHQVDVVLFDGTDTALKRNLKRDGINLICFGDKRVYHPSHIFKLIRLMRQYRYDVVHTHNTAPQLFAAIASIFVSSNLVTTEHSTSNRRRNHWFFHPLDRWMYGRYKKIICISKTAETSLRAYLRCEMPSICTIYNGVDLQKFFTASPSIEILTNYPNFKTAIMVARYCEAKDQPTLIKAYTHLPIEYHLFIVGDGDRRREFEALINELGLKDRVHLLGVRTDVPNLLKAVDVVVMSSHYEGLSLSNIEGMASGKPFIASDVDGLREMTNGYGVLFPEGDDVELAKEIQILSTDEEYRNRIVAQCRKRAEEFSIHRMVKGYDAVYKEIIMD